MGDVDSFFASDMPMSAAHLHKLAITGQVDAFTMPRLANFLSTHSFVRHLQIHPFTSTRLDTALKAGHLSELYINTHSLPIT